MNASVEPIDGDGGDSADDPKGRQRSTIGFPYTDFDAAASVARSIHDHVGHGTCSASAQLASWMGVSSKSSGFRTNLAAARLFGLIESDNAEAYRLTTLGTQLADPQQSRMAKAEAFLRVPLFKALYEKYKTGVTPPNAALEREIASLGVAEKQKARARQVFESSAQQTGFREHGPSRLVMPAVVMKPETQAVSEQGKGGGGGGNNSAGTVVNLDLDPLLIALLQKIPPQSEAWPAEKRLRWFRTFAMNVSQVYDDDAEPVEMDIGLVQAV
ncbi:hypothetical protein GTP23_07990 [Pseudoduganella sp. FT93W]|uniref:Uncharacterized protein n=1 Tax=Duganella fentianensis TaxID=2692177 RepID=A0A845HVF2_9BURK|nr:hypothetical protein [Duganella fentianensis]MYN45009.1 hypothetical protein [Duganella fentianensis]